MVATHPSKSAEIRAKLKHPIIDADGHLIELTPIMLDYVKQFGGAKMAEKYEKFFDAAVGFNTWYKMTPQQRRETMTIPTTWWGLTVNTLDRATVSLPRLLHSRMDELGIDFSILYPSWDLGITRQADAEFRQVGCRALNTFLADLYRPYADRMTVVAVIPTATPQEAIAELEHAVTKLGTKAIVVDGMNRRPIPAVQKEHPELTRYAYRVECLGLDNEYDYDPFWAKCVELGVSPTFHTGGQRLGARTSTTNFMFNHLGHFASSQEPIASALFLGGVTRRFPELRFAFLEGGVGWACRLYSDIIARWKKRNPKALPDLDPERLDVEEMMRLIDEYGEPMMAAKREELLKHYQVWSSKAVPRPENLDDYAAAKIDKLEDIKELFAGRFYFGCEADDPMNAWAFNTKVNPLGTRLKAMSSSDMGHWDVPDLREVTEELYEQVEEGLLDERAFRDFVFTNPASLWATTNSDFFKGTKVEAAVAAELKAGRLH